MTDYHTNRRNLARARGDCTTCCKRPAVRGSVRCVACGMAHRKTTRKTDGRRWRYRAPVSHLVVTRWLDPAQMPCFEAAGKVAA